MKSKKYKEEIKKSNKLFVKLLLELSAGKITAEQANKKMCDFIKNNK